MSGSIARLAFGAGVILTFATQAHAAGEASRRKEPSAAQVAARERMSKCSAEWKQAKAGGTQEAGLKWPKFWSQCNARLKGARS